MAAQVTQEGTDGRMQPAGVLGWLLDWELMLATAPMHPARAVRRIDGEGLRIVKSVTHEPRWNGESPVMSWIMCRRSMSSQYPMAFPPSWVEGLDAALVPGKPGQTGMLPTAS